MPFVDDIGLMKEKGFVDDIGLMSVSSDTIRKISEAESRIGRISHPVQQFNESNFQEWYKGWSSKLGLNPNPDDPRHQYDYRAAYKAGATPNESNHWPSEFKKEGHPNRFVDGVDTITGKPIPTLSEDTGK